MIKILKNRFVKTISISLIIAIIVSILLLAGFLSTWETKAADAYYTPTNTLDNIIIITIDDKSLYDSTLGGWPFPRDKYATVLNYLTQASVVGIDITFDLERDNDSVFADAIKQNNVVLALMYTDLQVVNTELIANNFLKPNESLGEAGQDFQIGFVNLYTDDLDKITRSFPTHISSSEEFDAFGEVIAETYTHKNIDLSDQRMLINYYGEPGDYEHISFSDVYHGEYEPDYFVGKIVLIGYAASDSYDHFIVPISSKSMAGVEIHANIIQSLVQEDYIFYQDTASSIIVIFLFALFIGYCLYKFRIHIATIIIIIVFVVYFFGSIYVFDAFGIILKILYPVFTIAMVYIPLVVMLYLTEERSRKWITSAFGRYVSKVVIQHLIKNPDQLNLGGEKKEITLFFSDIRKFTTISEKLTPEELVHLLNDYLTEMTDTILKDEGLVDKYMGDAIMAFWGAPLSQPDHAERACSTSLEMMDKLHKLQKKWKVKGLPSFNIGIGLNSGEAIVGNMGSKNRFDYTAIGDNVNIASRMEGLNKVYGTNIIISQKTYDKVKTKFETRKLDAVRVKGKKKPIKIYELLGHKTKLATKELDFVKLYEKGLDLYFKKDWKAAIKQFNAAIKIKKDSASKLFIARCNELIKNPPPKDWDGVWEMKSK